ncbi:2-dehydro-3-deoxy-6-phosphogalactonate aldolase [Aquidulcibacter sp.]|uniref:2-dehydro-3-deoxy-6-phosphogalactonate aldolase n=1 Tax=Aquidulcibacter sp. TaxID=2052990 RepID=UPI00345D77BB|nr:2-dehydro-3-deoxy-6-phosphogalactonate aldolase [Aquidulcibacter sp.]
MMHATAFAAALASCPLVAILRGLKPEEAIEVVEALYCAGFRIAEVPLNSPEPLKSISALRTHFGDRIIIGAGTVTEVQQVHDVADQGGQICVSPNMDPDVIGAALDRGMVALPGSSTPTEAFAAIKAGALYLKLFPAGSLGPEFLKAMSAVLPAQIQVLAVGGIGAKDFSAWRSTGVAGFGLGSEIYKPGDTPALVREKAERVMTAFKHHEPGAKLLCQPEAIIGESPIYVARLDSIFWVDPVQAYLFSYRCSDKVLTQLPLAHPVSSLAETETGLMAVANQSLFKLDPISGSLSVFAVCTDLGEGVSLTDMCADGVGGIWATAFHSGALAGKGKIIHCSSEGDVKIVASGLGIPNGIDLTPDGKKVIVADTLLRTLLAFDICEPRPELGAPRILSDFMGIAGKPDGLVVLPDHRILVAMWGGSSIAELSATGALLALHPIPVPHVSSVSTMPGQVGHCLVSTSRMRLSPAQLQSYPLSGGLFSLTI